MIESVSGVVDNKIHSVGGLVVLYGMELERIEVDHDKRCTIMINSLLASNSMVLSVTVIRHTTSCLGSEYKRNACVSSSPSSSFTPDANKISQKIREIDRKNSQKH